MEVNILAVILATVAMFAVGAIWYSLVFGKIWGKIHGFYELSKAKQKEMQSKMGPWYAVQLLVTIISAWVLAVLIGLLPEQSPFFIAFLVWIGFTVPVVASDMIFGVSPDNYVWHKIAITSSDAIIRLMVAAWIISLF